MHWLGIRYALMKEIWFLLLLNGCGGGAPGACCLHSPYLQMVERKGPFNQNAGNLGRWWPQRPPKTTSRDSTLSPEIFKGKEGGK